MVGSPPGRYLASPNHPQRRPIFTWLEGLEAVDRIEEHIPSNLEDIVNSSSVASYARE